MINEIYYLIGLIFVTFEMYIFTNTTNIISYANELNSIKHYKDNVKYNPGISQESARFGCFSIFYILWIFIGLFTDQWVVASFLFLISFAPKFLKDNQYYVKLDSIVCGSLIIFMMVNHYQLHINLLGVIQNIGDRVISIL